MADQDISKELLDFQPLILRRHPLNLLAKSLWALGMFLPLIVIQLAVGTIDFGIVPQVQVSQWLFGGLFLIFIISFFMMQWVFWYLDVWLLTRDRLIDVQMLTFFNRRVAQLNLAQVEDVRVETKGFLASLFHFGDITVQTAGRDGVFELRSIPSANDIVTLISDLSTEAQRALTQDAVVHTLKPNKLLGQILVGNGLITEQQLSEALHEQRRTHEPLGQILVQKKLITPEDLVHALAEQYNIPAMDLKNYQLDESLVTLLPQDKARHYLALPVYKSPDNVVSLALAHPTPEKISELMSFIDHPVTFLVASETDITEAIDKYYNRPGGATLSAPSHHDEPDPFWLK